MSSKLTDSEKEKLLENCPPVEWAADSICPCCGRKVFPDTVGTFEDGNGLTAVEIVQKCDWCGWESDTRIE